MSIKIWKGPSGCQESYLIGCLVSAVSLIARFKVILKLESAKHLTEYPHKRQKHAQGPYHRFSLNLGGLTNSWLQKKPTLETNWKHFMKKISWTFLKKLSNEYMQ